MDLLQYIRFPLMTSADLATKVVPAGILDIQQQLDLFAYIGAVAARKDESEKVPKLGKSIEKMNAKRRIPLRVEFSWGPYASARVEGRRVTALNTTCHIILADKSFKSGKHTWKVRVVTHATCYSIGVAAPSINRTQGYIGNSADGWCLNQSGQTEHQGSYHNDTSGSYSQLTSGDVVTVELDMDSRTLNFKLVSRTWPTMNITVAEVYPAIMVYQNAALEVFFD